MENTSIKKNVNEIFLKKIAEQESEYVHAYNPIFAYQYDIVNMISPYSSGYLVEQTIMQKGFWDTPVPDDIDGEKKVADYHLQHWNEVKKELCKRFTKPSYKDIDALCEDYFEDQLDQKIAQEPERADELEKLRCIRNMGQLYNILQDMGMYLNNSGYHREIVTFCKDLLDIFDFSDDRDEELHIRCTIGSALACDGQRQACIEYYDKLLKQCQSKSDEAIVVNSYAFALMYELSGPKDDGDSDSVGYMNPDHEAAKKLLENYISLDMPCDDENEVLYERAVDFYRNIGDQPTSTKYRSKLDAYHREKKRMLLKQFRKKIYPNDPCPCRSGKKYKKCCGRI